MHLIVSWDIPDGPEWDTLNQQMVSCFSGYDWCKPLSTFYVVGFSGPYEDFSAIHDALLRVARKGNIQFVLVPVFGNVGHSGFLVKDKHDSIERIVRPKT